MSAKQSGRVAGSSEMTVAITDLLIDNRMHPVATQPLQAKTENTAKKSGRTIIGAKNAAKVGVGASILTGGNKINIPAGTLVETQFRAPFTTD